MQDSEQIRIAVIYGSTRWGRLCDSVAGWLRRGLAERPDFTVDVLDPLELPVSAWSGEEESAGMASLRARAGKADAYIVVTPEYNHSYPAALKQLIDSVYYEWHAKPVAFVSYGGKSGGLRAVEHLRQVFVELHAVAIRDSVSLAHAGARFDENGELVDGVGPARELQVMLKRLRWWSLALREAREKAPYAEALARVDGLVDSGLKRP